MPKRLQNLSTLMKVTASQLRRITKLIFLAFLTSAGQAQTTFTQVTTGPIATDQGEFLGAAWGDFHNDGLLDLIDANWEGLANVFYQNNGNGTFTKITGQDPVLDLDYHVIAAAGDYDNDGNLDLVVTSGVGAPTPRRTLLYHNDGDAKFSRVSGGIVTNQLGYFGIPAFADYDNDGFLDLFVTDLGPGDEGAKNLLFHNNGDGTFSSITNGPIVSDFGLGYDASWIDYDDDGFVDLLVINRFLTNSHNFLYHNNGDGSFTRVLTNAIATDVWADGATTEAWGDYDNDGLPDLFIADNNGARNRLYHNNGNGAFTNVASGPMLLPPSGGFSYSAAWGDYDNDGYLDLFVVNYGDNNALFHNNKNGTFTQVLAGSAGAPVQHSGGGVCTWVDYDNDGFLDLFLAGGEPGPLPHFLYHNNGNTNAWIEIKCVGTVANRSAIGTKVRVQATIDGKTFWQVRAIGGGLPLVAHFGLGDATNVNTLRVEWPSGTVQEFQNVAAKQILTITEPPRLMAALTNGFPQFSIKGGRFFQYEIESSTDLSNWSSIGTVMVTNFNGAVQITDTNAPSAKAIFYRAISR
jgi:enediyne biosynthesis protein E4